MVAIKMKMPRKCADCRFAQRHYDEWYWCAAECRNMKKAGHSELGVVTAKNDRI